MIKRIVKLHFKATHVPKFISLFERSKDKIRNQEGCLSLKLLKSTSEAGVYFTLSWWENETALEKYRSSALFREVWTETKALFKEKAEAWTVESITDL